MNIWNRDEVEDDFDGWEGDALGTLEVVGGEIDWSEMIDDDDDDDDLDQRSEDEEEDCECLEADDSQECDRCFHTIKCSAEPCANSVHQATLRAEYHRKRNLFGNPKDCGCAQLADGPVCQGCDHREDCLEKKLSACPDEYHSTQVIISRDGCGCAIAPSLGIQTCSLCNHDEFCDLAVGCADDAFHDFIPVGTVRCSCLPGMANPCPTCGHRENCMHREACSERWFHFPGAPLTEVAKPFDHLPVRDVEGSLPSKHKTLWSRPEDEQLVRLFGSGLDFAEIAAEHERTPGSITRRLAMLCFDQNGVLIKSEPIDPERANQTWTADDDELLTTLHVNKLGLTLLSSALKRSQRAVAIRLMHLRLVAPCDLDKVRYYSGAESGAIPNRNAGWTTPQYVEVREAFRQGSSLVEIAQLAGRSEASCLMVLFSRGEITTEDLQKAVDSAHSHLGESL
jgi:hypothetical protein